MGADPMFWDQREQQRLRVNPPEGAEVHVNAKNIIPPGDFIPAYLSHDDAARAGKYRGCPFRIVAKTLYLAEPIDLRATGERVALSREDFNYIPVDGRWIKVAPKGDGGQSVTVE